MENVLTRLPKGASLSHRIELHDNPDRVIYRPEANDEVTYMGTLTQGKFYPDEGEIKVAG